MGTVTERVPGMLLIAAGTAWVVKASVILATGMHPSALIPTGLLICALGLFIVLSRFPKPRRRIVAAGIIATGAALVFIASTAVMEMIPGAAISRGEDFVFPYSFLMLFGTISIFFAMFVLGLMLYRGHQNSDRNGSAVFLAVAFMPLPAAATGMIHSELPVLLIGLSWAVVGVVILVSSPNELRESAARVRL